MLRLAETYADAIRAFRWDIPARYNIGVDVVDKHVAAGHGDRLALVHEPGSGAIERFSFPGPFPPKATDSGKGLG